MTKQTWVAIGKTCNTHLDCDRRKVSGKIARDVQGNRKDPNSKTGKSDELNKNCGGN